jgi:hypothetical protein
MLTTALKPKLPKFAAWPMGKVRLEEALAEFDHLNGAEVTFRDYIVTRFVSDPKHRQQPYPVLEVEFTRQWNPDGQWRFHVWAVPYGCAPRIRELVTAELLPRLRTWFQNHHEPEPNATRPRLSFISHYNEGRGCIEYDDR